MNWKDIASAGKSIGKLDSLDVSENTKVTMEAIMCAMAASRKVQEMGLIAQTLEKVDTQVDLKTVSNNLSELIGIMKTKEQPKVADEDSITMTRAQFEQMRTELSAGK